MTQVPCKIVPVSSKYIPEYQTKHSSGMDLVAAESITLYPFKPTMLDVGFKASCPPGFEFQVRPRSGLSLKGVTVFNSPGTVDADYTGDYKVVLINMNPNNILISEGTRIAQLVLCPVYKCDWIVTDILKQTVRGEGGFGHTGN